MTSVGALKTAMRANSAPLRSGGDRGVGGYDEPKREDEVFRNVMENNPGPLPSDAAKRVFERIIDEMRVVQRMKMENPECS